MSKYTPSTEIVRAKYRYPGESSVEDAEFDRWMNQVKEDVWDEVATWFESERNSPGSADEVEAANPYRKQEEA